MPFCPQVPVSRVVAWLAGRLAAYSAKVREAGAVQAVVMVGFGRIGSVVAVYTEPVVLAISAVEAVAAWSRPRGSPRICAVRCAVYTCPYPSYS